MRGWIEASLEDHIRLIDYRGRTPIKTESGVRLITAKNVKLGFLQLEPQEFIAPDNYESWMSRGIPNYGDVIFTTEAPLGNVAQLDIKEKVAFAQRIIVMQPDPSKIDQTFLKYMLLSNRVRQTILEKGTGATVQGIKSSLLRKIRISFPALVEQKRIVTILDDSLSALDKAKANTEQNLKNAKELLTCTISNFLNGGWIVKTLGEVCEKVEYGTSTKSKTKGKMPVLRMGNIQNGRFNWDKLVYSDNSEDNHNYLLKYNDVLFNRTNSPELVGKTAIYKGEMPAIFAGYLIRLNRKEKLLDADYLNYYLNSEMATKFGKTVVISSVNQANINGTKLKSYPIPLPPIETQQAIVKKLDGLRDETEKLEAIYEKKIRALDELRISVLQKAFSGELKGASQ